MKARGITGAYSQGRPSVLNLHSFPVHKTTSWKSRKWALWMKFDIVGDGPARKYFQIRWSDQKSRKNTSTQPTAHTLKSFLDGMSQTVWHSKLLPLDTTPTFRHLLMTEIRNNVHPSSSYLVTISPGIQYYFGIITCWPWTPLKQRQSPIQA